MMSLQKALERLASFLYETKPGYTPKYVLQIVIYDLTNIVLLFTHCSPLCYLHRKAEYICTALDS